MMERTTSSSICDPENASEDDQAKRNHSVQYSSAPDFRLGEAAQNLGPSSTSPIADLQADEWTKLKIDVQGREAKLYVNGSDKPSLIVEGLKGEDLEGAIALWGYTGEEAYFSNLKISNQKTAADRERRRRRRHVGCDVLHRWRRLRRHSEAGSSGQQPRRHMVRRTWTGPAGERYLARRFTWNWHSVERGTASLAP